MPTMLVATREGLHTLGADGDLRSVEYPGRAVTALGRAGAGSWAILDAAEVWRSSEDGWSRVAGLTGLRATCVAAIGPEVFVGTSEARLLRLAGGALEPVEGFDRVEGRDAWSTPWGGPPDTRSIANWDDDLYVNVHVGGIPRTQDDGATWSPTIDIHADVHHVTTAEGLVLAACAGGLATSADRGATWTYRTEGLEGRYSRAVAVCGDVLLLSASNGPRGGHAGVYRGRLAAGRLERCHAGLPEWFEDNIDTYRLDALPDGSFAAFGTADGSVYRSTDQGSRWEPCATGLPSILRVLVMP